MEGVCAACAVYESCLVDYSDLKSASELVWLLGKKYCVRDELSFTALKKDVRSILWFTYRKQFLEIGSTGLTSDFGWGCMHRCGQMMFAQALIRRYLGQDWVWEPGTLNSTYLQILNMFNDKEECRYSIHNIAIRGKEMDKKVGEWYGPNTAAQVIRKLLLEDEKIDIVIHIALDNMVITSEIRSVCKNENVSSSDSKGDNSPRTQNRNEANEMGENVDKISSQQYQGDDTRWQPLLLIIPLRLGLTDVSEKYIEKIKASFTLKSSLGILGGRTNHASYFIGYTGNELIFLDPHTTQQHYSDITSGDETYHCEFPGRMSFRYLDPSVALCFYCDTEENFEDWCRESQRLLLEPKEDAIFEILEKKPPPLSCLEVDFFDDSTCQSLSELSNERIYTSDDEFEVIW